MFPILKLRRSGRPGFSPVTQSYMIIYLPETDPREPTLLRQLAIARTSGSGTSVHAGADMALGF